MAGNSSTTWGNQAMDGNNFKSITILMFIAAGALLFFILFMVSSFSKQGSMSAIYSCWIRARGIPCLLTVVWKYFKLK